MHLVPFNVHVANVTEVTMASAKGSLGKARPTDHNRIQTMEIGRALDPGKQRRAANLLW